MCIAGVICFLLQFTGFIVNCALFAGVHGWDWMVRQVEDVEKLA